MEHATFFISQPQYDWLAAKLPEPVSKTRKITPNNELLNGVLFVLKTGCRWQDIPASICVRLQFLLAPTQFLAHTRRSQTRLATDTCFA